MIKISVAEPRREGGRDALWAADFVCNGCIIGPTASFLSSNATRSCWSVLDHGGSGSFSTLLHYHSLAFISVAMSPTRLLLFMFDGAVH